MFRLQRKSESDMTHNHYHNVNVTEKRAPTDESVRLLKELEKAAFDKMLGSFELPSNVVRSRVAVNQDPLRWKNQFYILTEINGKKYEMRVDVDSDRDRREQIDLLYKGLSEQLAQIIMPDVFNEAMAQHLF